METIFVLPLFFLACIQSLIALLLLAPSAIRLPVAHLIRTIKKNAAANSVVVTSGVVLAGLLVSCILELFRSHERAVKADVREVVSTIDYLRTQVSTVLCALNLLLLFLARALADALCAAEHSAKNLDAMQRQVKGLQAEYQRATNTSQSAGANAGGGATAGSSELETLKKQLDKAIADKMSLQVSMETADKARASAEANVAAMKSQLKGFDKEFDRILEENNYLKRRLAGAGDPKYAAEVAAATQHTAGGAKKAD